MVDVFDVTPAARGFFSAAALHAAHELDLFAALPAPLEALAARLGVGARRLRALVDVLALDGVVVRGADIRAARVPPRPPPPPAAGLGRLAEILRADAPVIEPETEESLGRYHAHLAAAGADHARALAARLGPVRSLLDAGGGAGGYTAALLSAHPDARARLVDRPAVVRLARAALAKLGERVAFVAGDLADADFGAEHDVALLANVTHWLGPADAARAIARAAAALATGGRLVVKDFYVAPDRSGPEAALLFALAMAAYSEAGDVYDAPTTERWLAGAGLVDIATERLDDSAMVCSGRKP